MPLNYNPQKQKHKMNVCPHCGWQTSDTFYFQQMIDGAPPGGGLGDFVAHRETPVRAYRVESDLLVPAGQALASAIFIAMPATAITIWLAWPWYFPLLCAAAVASVYWFRHINQVNSNSSVVESVSFYPLADKDDFQSVPEKKRPIRLDVIHSTSGIRHTMQLLDLPAQISEVEFGQFMRDVLAGRSLARREWEGSGKPFSRDGYDGLIQALVSASIAEKGPGGGKRLTNAGRHAIAAMVREGQI